MSAPREAIEVRLVPPLAWASGTVAERAARLPTLAGITVALVSNSKANSGSLLDDLANELVWTHGVREVLRHEKPHPSLPIDDAVLTMFAEHAHAVLTAIGD